MTKLKLKIPSSKKGKATLVGIGALILGLILMGYSYGSLLDARGKLTDRNGDGLVDWHDTDLNNDGFVNILDQTLMNNAIASGTYVARYDLNGDGVVDEADRNILLAYWTTLSLSVWGPLTSLSTGWGQGFWAGAVVSVVGLGVVIMYGRKKHR